MNDQADSQLLRAYAERHSDPAFAELVRRHIDLVHSAALRMVCDAHLAQDMTQAVFLALAKNAAQLTDRPVLSGWLHRTAQNIAAQTVRTDVRRRAREQEAAAMNELLSATPDASWNLIAPQLDAALGELAESERDALFLRYFERKSAREMATQLGISDDAAQKRVSRAVERLREFFAKRGVTVGAGGLAVVISANAVQAAPIGLALTISTAATLAGTTVATAIATQTTMNWINLKSATVILTAALAAGSGTYLVQRQSVDQLRTENQKLAAAQQTLTKERVDALAAASHGIDELKRWESERIELLRLRGEVGQLRRKAQEFDQLAEENRQYEETLSKLALALEAESESETLERRFAMERSSQSRQIVLGVRMYAEDNKGMLPPDLNTISVYLGNQASELLLNHPFELVLQGALTNVSNPSATIAIRSKSPFVMSGRSVKVYGFADGHTEIQREPTEGFEAWENARIIPAAPTP